MEEKKEEVRKLNLHLLRNGKSKITCGPRPKIGNIKPFKEVYGINMILTLLNEKEKPETIKTESLKNEMKWDNIPLQGAKPEYLQQKSTVEIISEKLFQVYCDLNDNQINCYIHCAGKSKKSFLK